MNRINLVERPIADDSWPTTLKLSITECNWVEWSRRLTLLADQLYVLDYLDGTLPCPDSLADPARHNIWMKTDKSLRALMLEHLSLDDYDIAITFPTSHRVFEELQNRHEKLGLHVQLNLLIRAFGIQYTLDVPLSTTSKEIRDIHTRIIKMGKFDDDKLLIILIINALNNHYGSLQSTVHSMTDDANFSLNTAFKHINTEAALELRHTEGGQGGIVLLSTSHIAKERDNTNKVICSNCKWPYHTTNLCVAPGGKMFGKSLDEAL
jgi:hypothetical protein